ncbi:MAG: hypothetical protein NC393_01745 [Clostridium sp.]|nr:hypothetical protein [Clostridium sp.]MCM1170827.1 hypothetical protein [Clostridium sp.]MCM1208442.1 hypothetical protein [Ruminococcus sp.]
MEQCELQAKINKAKNEIVELRYNIQSMYDRKDAYGIEKSKAYNLIDQVEAYYSNKQNKIKALEGVKGRANTTMLAKLMDLFSYESMNVMIDGYECIADYIQNNIRMADEKIEEAEDRIRRLQINIYNWENEIRNMKIIESEI